MRISSTSRPRSTTVTAYLDGTANMIQPPVLRGHGQLQAAAERYQHLDVDVTGQRLDQKKELQSAATYFAGAGAVAALGTAVGRAFGTEVGLCVGLFAAPPLLIAARHVQTAFTERSFHPGAPCAQSAQADRLLETLTQQSARNPGARKVAYFSGHGSHRTIAGFDPQTLGKVLRQSPVDLTVLDACTTAQIEVLSQMAPQAGLVICSSQPVPGRGFPIEEMLKADSSLPIEAFEAAKGSTAALSLIDSEELKGQLLPSLDQLGSSLANLAKTEKSALRKVLRKSRNPDLISARVDLASFLEKLEESPLAKRTELKESLTSVRRAYRETVLRHQGSALTFRLDGDQNAALPSGWNSFIRSMNLMMKPVI